MSNFNEYLKNYKNCADFCGAEFISDAELSTCIEDIKKDNSSFCSINPETECSVINTEKFKLFIIYLIKFLKIQYCCRFYYGNIYDVDFISFLGTLDIFDKFRLTYDELTCVLLADFVKAGMPNNLGDYFLAMKEIKKILNINPNELVKNAKTNNILKNYSEFVADFQPWSILLVTCVQNFVKELGLPYEIPDITKISNYGLFISDCKKKEIDFIIESLRTNPTVLNDHLDTMIGGNQRVSTKHIFTKKRRVYKFKNLRKSHRKSSFGKKKRKSNQTPTN